MGESELPRSAVAPLADWFQGQRRARERYFVLFREGRRIVAAEGSHLIDSEEKDWPAEISIRGRRYRRLMEEDTWVFWDELRDDAKRTVGYVLHLPASPTFWESSFLNDSENVVLDSDWREATVILQPCKCPQFECEQAFGLEVYARSEDSRDCALLMMEWSAALIAFPLVKLSN